MKPSLIEITEYAKRHPSRFKAALLLIACALPLAAQFTSAHSIWSRPIDPAAPTDGYAIVWSASQGRYTFGSVSVPSTTPSCDKVTVAVSGANWSVTLNGAATTTAITAASNTQTLTIETLPAHSIVYGSRVYETVKYAGTALSTLTISGGATTTTDYFPAKSLVGAACSTPGTLAATCVQFNPLGGYAITDASHSFTLTLIATGTANLAALTAGSVDVALCRGIVQ